MAETARGIPEAIFIENVENYLKDHESTDQALTKMQDHYRLTQSKANLKNKIPDISKTLDTVKYLESKKEDEVLSYFELADNVFAQAKISKPSSVSLWLGANVMVEYSYEEATELLSKNLESAKKSLATIEEDLDFLKDQITTTEVNIARVYNHDVKVRRSQKEGNQ